jgi:hypothetical protein
LARASATVRPDPAEYCRSRSLRERHRGRSKAAGGHSLCSRRRPGCPSESWRLEPAARRAQTHRPGSRLRRTPKPPRSSPPSGSAGATHATALKRSKRAARRSRSGCQSFLAESPDQRKVVPVLRSEGVEGEEAANAYVLVSFGHRGDCGPCSAPLPDHMLEISDYKRIQLGGPSTRADPSVHAPLNFGVLRLSPARFGNGPARSKSE